MIAKSVYSMVGAILSSGVWMGTEESLMAVLASAQPTMNVDAAAMHERDSADNDPVRFGGTYHYMMNQYYDVAVIDIRGSLTPYEHPYNKYYGIMSYEEIRNAVVTAVNDEAISTILFKMDSPGGAAKGVDECCEFLQKVNAERIPIYTFVSGQMASAGYFLGSVGRKIYTSKMSTIGSIGSFVPIMSYFRMLQEQGIDAKIIRSPELKALGHPIDPLTDEAEAAVQETIDSLTEVFEGYVAENRGTSVQVIRSNYGQGKVFVGEKAVTQGLADEVLTFDAVVNKLRSSTNSEFI
jgi:signal peptide peptidase SppA